MSVCRGIVALARTTQHLGAYLAASAVLAVVAPLVVLADAAPLALDSLAFGLGLLAGHV
jgi:hypothetical protein